jgi:lysylphosphatidylglycerol synthase-like protein
MIGRMRSRGAGLTGILTAAGGLALLGWLVHRLGAAQIWAGVRQVGWGLVPIVIVAGLRFLARASAWRLCLDDPRRLRLRDALSAVICGDMIGNLTPLGPLVGEPAKAALVRRHIALGPAATALAIENVLYTLSAAAMIAAGMVALLARFTLPPSIRDVSVISIAATVALFGVALWVLWRQPALISRALGRMLGRSDRGRERLGRIRDVERELYSFASRRLAALPLLALIEIAFHALGVLEVHITLWLMNGAAPPLMTSFILETTNRLITVVFRFVPLRLGVDEAATAFFTDALGLGATQGITLALVRKARILFWAAVGALLLVRQGFTPTLPADPPSPCAS